MRAVIFIIIISIHFILGLPYLGLIYLIGIFNYKQRIKMAYAYNRLTSWWLYTISGAKFVTQGLENLYQDTNVVYVGNHRSMIDIPLMMLFMKDPIILIGKDSIKKWPFISWWLHAMGGYFLDRSSGKAGFKTIISAINRIKNGESCLIYPEGTRSRTQEMLPFKQGSFKLASKPCVPIIPMAVLGTADVFENNKINLKPETIYFSVGEPIYLDQLSEENQRSSAKYVQSIIQIMYDELLDKQAIEKASK